jgi:RES domain-containing protein
VRLVHRASLSSGHGARIASVRWAVVPAPASYLRMGVMWVVPSGL